MLQRAAIVALLLFSAPCVAQTRPITDEIAAIRGDAQSDKPSRVARLKSQRLYETAQSVSECSVGDVRITLVRKALRPDGHLEFTLRARRAGADMRMNNPYVFVNPPVMVPNPASVREDDKFVESPQEALCAIILGAVK